MKETTLAHSLSAFCTLALPTDATEAAVVDRDLQLAGRKPEAAETYRDAREQLLERKRDRLRHELLEIPGAAYPDDEWEPFCRKFERNPVGLTRFTQDSGTPGAADFDWPAFLHLAIEERLSTSTSDLAPAIQQPPFPPGYGPPPLEVYDVIFG
jgi:hypothetical protein